MRILKLFVLGGGMLMGMGESSQARDCQSFRSSDDAIFFINRLNINKDQAYEYRGSMDREAASKFRPKDKLERITKRNLVKRDQSIYAPHEKTCCYRFKKQGKSRMALRKSCGERGNMECFCVKKK